MRLIKRGVSAYLLIQIFSLFSIAQTLNVIDFDASNTANAQNQLVTAFHAKDYESAKASLNTIFSQDNFNAQDIGLTLTRRILANNNVLDPFESHHHGASSPPQLMDSPLTDNNYNHYTFNLTDEQKTELANIALSHDYQNPQKDIHDFKKIKENCGLLGINSPIFLTCKLFNSYADDELVHDHAIEINKQKADINGWLTQHTLLERGNTLRKDATSHPQKSMTVQGVSVYPQDNKITGQELQDKFNLIHNEPNTKLTDSDLITTIPLK